MSENYCLYKHTGPTGLVYIGITKQRLEDRWKNGKGYIDCPKFFHAIQKYGWDAFTHEVIAEGLTKAKAEALEIEYIARYKSNQKGFGYNIAAGGSAASPTEATKRQVSEKMATRWADADYRQKVVESMTGRTRSETAKANISLAQKKRFEDPRQRELVGLRQIGKARTEEAKKKTSETLKRYYTDPKNIEAYKKAHEGVNRKRLARPVLCIETGELFEAVIDASKKMGIERRNIIKVCRGERSKAGGFSWRYVKEI